MADIQSKLEKEFHSNRYCGICFSIDRKLTQMEDLCTIYQNLLNSYDYTNSYSDLLICWECKCVLQKLKIFQNKVNISNNLLMKHTKHNILQNPLSTLTKVVISENSHQIIHHKEDDLKDEAIVTDESYHNDDFVEQEVKITDRKKIDNNKIPTKNLWAQKRAILNKKSKFINRQLNSSDIPSLYFKLRITKDEINELISKEKCNGFFVRKKYKCMDCLRGFNKQSYYLKHMTLFHEESETSLKCTMCDTRSQTRQQLDVHIDAHTQKFQCKLCMHVCYKEHHIHDHITHRHKSVYMCATCEVKFCHEKEALEHHRKMHETFICDYCGVSFKMRYCLKNHIRKKHQPVICEICSRTFTRYNSLWLHRKLKHNIGEHEKSYCVECNKYFNNIYSYKWHLNNSVKHKPRKKQSFPCLACNKIFTKNAYMKDHYNLIHLKEHKFHCEQCDKNFVRNADLMKHKRRVHDGVMTPKNKICYICGRGFTTNIILNNHIRTHTGERPFNCNYCTAKFAQKVSLSTHIKLVHFKIKKQSETAWNGIGDTS